MEWNRILVVVVERGNWHGFDFGPHGRVMRWKHSRAKQHEAAFIYLPPKQSEFFKAPTAATCMFPSMPASQDGQTREPIVKQENLCVSHLYPLLFLWIRPIFLLSYMSPDLDGSEFLLISSFYTVSLQFLLCSTADLSTLFSFLKHSFKLDVIVLFSIVVYDM